MTDTKNGYFRIIAQMKTVHFTFFSLVKNLKTIGRFEISEP
ncbi:hypothetical protein ACVR0P_00760 [Streptococcus castoreus]|nr:hypothetical protein [Streptococcus castoreus]